MSRSIRSADMVLWTRNCIIVPVKKYERYDVFNTHSFYVIEGEILRYYEREDDILKTQFTKKNACMTDSANRAAK